MIGYCVDVGAVARGRFGWARADFGASEWKPCSSVSMEALVGRLGEDLEIRRKVALGFECPLFVPVRSDPTALTMARAGEGARAWSAGAGIASMGVGLVQSIWLMERLRLRLHGDVPPVHLRWRDFANAGSGLFIWEAFVSQAAKAAGPVETRDRRDAEIGLRAFKSMLPHPDQDDAVDETTVHSLIGSVLLRTGWTSRVEVLSQPCLVIKAPA